MLVDIITSAHALVHLAEERGDDPEPVAAQFVDCTVAEVRQIVRRAYRLGLSREAEWAGDFVAAHRSLRKAGHREPVFA